MSARTFARHPPKTGTFYALSPYTGAWVKTDRADECADSKWVMLHVPGAGQLRVRWNDRIERRRG